MHKFSGRTYVVRYPSSQDPIKKTKKESRGLLKMNHFKNIILIGEGTYGRVYKAKIRDTDKTIAIKRIEIELESGLSFTTIREVKMLKKLRSSHVVRLEDIFFEKEFLYLIMEFLPFDLTGLIQNGYVFSREQVLSLSYQLIDAARYIHSFGLVHRDIKSSNILIDRNGLLKLADFGLTREVSELMTNRVCTLWYRAPELLLGAQSYDIKVDSWSIACVILEMNMKRPPFKGNDEVSQIRLIFEVLGVPSESYIWSDMLLQKSYTKNDSWDAIIHNAYGEYLEKRMLKLIGELLRLSPRERLSPLNALKLCVLPQDYNRLIPIVSEEVHEYYCKKNKVKADEYKNKL